MDNRARAYLLLADGTERRVPLAVPEPASAGEITVAMHVPDDVPGTVTGWRVEADWWEASGLADAAAGDTVTAVIDGYHVQMTPKFHADVQPGRERTPDELLDEFRDADARCAFGAATSAARRLDEHLSAGGTLPAAWATATHIGTDVQVLGEMAPDDLRGLLQLVALDYGQAKTEIARLRAELDQYAAGRVVLLCLSRDAESAQAASRGERDGTILRTTDTGAEWVLASGRWARVP